MARLRLVLLVAMVAACASSDRPAHWSTEQTRGRAVRSVGYAESWHVVCRSTLRGFCVEPGVRFDDAAIEALLTNEASAIGGPAGQLGGRMQSGFDDRVEVVVGSYRNIGSAPFDGAETAVRFQRADDRWIQRDTVTPLYCP